MIGGSLISKDQVANDSIVNFVNGFQYVKLAKVNEQYIRNIPKGVVAC